jgi:phosphohistidine phosphatase SixA
MGILIRHLIAAVMVGLVCGCAPMPLHDTQAASSPVTAATSATGPFIRARALIVVRHADIDVAQKATRGNALPLLAAGEQRAKGLVPALQNAGITRIITSPAVRAQQTAAPLAAALHVTPEEGPASAQELFAMLAQTATPGQTILVVHHHSIMPTLMAELGFARETAADDATEFDRVYLILPDAERRTYQLFRLRYGGSWD